MPSLIQGWAVGFIFEIVPFKDILNDGWWTEDEHAPSDGKSISLSMLFDQVISKQKEYY